MPLGPPRLPAPRPSEPTTLKVTVGK
jgi:hypothetical protein